MPEIMKFDDPVLLIGGGEHSIGLLNQYKHLPIVAADGGANHLRELLGSAAVPKLILGDLDSLDDREHWESVTHVQKVAEQDSTDFEKCLYSVDAPFFIAAGFCGRRLDHTLAALHVMHKYSNDKRVILTSSHDVLLVSSESVILNLPAKTRVSIYPLSAVTFASSEGLQYPLDGLTLTQGVQIGTSNSSVADTVEINPVKNSGVFAIMLPIDCASAIVEWYSA